MLGNGDISVIIPCFNCSETIERAVQSVVAQTLQPLELILIDDKSSDNGKTIDTLYKIRTKYQELPIRIIKEEYNQGAGMARNKGWDLARGKYVAFLDADDVWHPQKLLIQRGIFANPTNRFDLVAHKFIKVKDIDELNIIKQVDEYRCKSVNKVAMLLKNPAITPSVMLRKDIPLRFRCGKRYGEDILLWDQIAWSKYSVGVIDYPLGAVFKEFYGDSGLSARLFDMEINEIKTFYLLFKESYIPLFFMVIAQVLSIIKYLRRLFYVSLR